jgi:hypothetical protein
MSNEIYLAMDKSGRIYGFDQMPVFNTNIDEWRPASIKDWWYSPGNLSAMGIDVTKFQITYETPIKIRAVWEVVE